MSHWWTSVLGGTQLHSVTRARALLRGGALLTSQGYPYALESSPSLYPPSRVENRSEISEDPSEISEDLSEISEDISVNLAA